MHPLLPFATLLGATFLLGCQDTTRPPEMQPLSSLPLFAAEGGGCPAGFSSLEFAPGQPPDRNGDGLICEKEIVRCNGMCSLIARIRIDNNVPGAATATCPGNFQPAAVSNETADVDRNGDGYICGKETAGGVTFIDNTM